MDVGSATLKLNDDGFYTLMIGAADMGTGCDTTLAQIAAEVLDCPLDNITVFGADTDTSPYDSGSYASSTTYVTGKATEKCAMKLRGQICKLGAELLECTEDEVEFDGKDVFKSKDPTQKKSLSEIAYASQFGHMVPLEATETHTSPLSPPPFMVGAAEVEVDTETGEVKLLEFDACVDCGTPINPNLTRVQAEGGLLQGIGMTLTENITYDKNGYPEENSLFQYKIPARTDVGKIKVEFESSYEPNGPFGAKSIGEVVINTPLLPFPMPSITLSAPGSMSCPSHRKKSPWQLQKSRNDRRKNFSVSCGEGTCYFSGGRRRKDHTAVQSGCALRPQAGGYWPLPPPILCSRPAGSWHRRMQSFSACGSAAVMPWPEPLHTAAN